MWKASKQSLKIVECNCTEIVYWATLAIYKEVFPKFAVTEHFNLQRNYFEFKRAHQYCSLLSGGVKHWGCRLILNFSSVLFLLDLFSHSPLNRTLYC